jgi:hypothetical protein
VFATFPNDDVGSTIGEKFGLSDVYQKFGSRVDAISDILSFLVKLDEGQKLTSDWKWDAYGDGGGERQEK